MTTNSDITLDQMLRSIDNRIELLQTSRKAIVLAWGGTPTISRSQPATFVEQLHGSLAQRRPVGRPAKLPKSRRIQGNVSALVIAALLSRGAMSTDQVFAAISRDRAWRTRSRDPKSVVSAALYGLAKQNRVVKLGGGVWGPPPAAPATEALAANQ